MRAWRFPLMILLFSSATTLAAAINGGASFGLSRLGPLASSRQRHEREKRSLGCSDASFHALAWRAMDFYFHSYITYSTPSHQVVGGWVVFNLSNTALPFEMGCSATSAQPQDFFYSNQWYRCQGPDTKTADAALFSFDRSAGRLSVNQSWVCEDDQWPTIFNASGATNMTLDCTTSQWQNQNWTAGEIYSNEIVDCAVKNVTIQPIALEAYSA